MVRRRLLQKLNGEDSILIEVDNHAVSGWRAPVFIHAVRWSGAACGFHVPSPCSPIYRQAGDHAEVRPPPSGASTSHGTMSGSLKRDNFYA